MIASFWRNTHFLLAITASLFLIVAAISGAVLGLEAAWDRTTPQAVKLNDLTLGEVIEKIETQFEEIYEIELNTKGFLIVQGATENSFGSYYVNPNDGVILGKVKKPSSFFQFIRSLHRSLFLKETGRILMSLVSFLMVLMVVSGLFLLRKRMGGFAKLYAPVQETNFHRKKHIILGRWLWLILLSVGVTGTYLGLNRLDFFLLQQAEKQMHEPGSMTIDLNSITLNKFEKIIYPFSNTPEEQFDLNLKDRSITFQQGDLSIIQVTLKSWPKLIQKYSYALHTGEGNFLLALLLTITSFALLYFIFSGLKISSKTSWELLRFGNRKQKKPLLILYGSETGNTYGFAKLLKKRLRKEGLFADLSSMNRFRLQQNTQTVIVLTATYGEGEAPANAERFVSLFNHQIPEGIISFAVLGFGSKSYPKFCQFAVEVNALLDQHPNYNSLMPLFKVNNQEENAYHQWETLLINSIRLKNPI